MEKILMMVEVSRKQDYIFSSKKLRENAARSGEIAHVTGSSFFQEAAGEVYQEQENLVYSGGGHTVLQFPSREQAVGFAQRVTEAALRRYDGMELFVKCLPYDGNKTPGENLKDLSAALERKKALRKVAFRYTSLGVEALDSESFLPLSTKEPLPSRAADILPAPEGWKYPAQFSDLVGTDNFLAVVHIDGNAMGKRVENLYQTKTASWEECRASLQRFSAGIQADFEQAFLETVETVTEQKAELQPPMLPIRPVILAGDDVCFVTAGSIGLECARIFLERLSGKTNQEDGKPYAACAGVALVHQKFPFHQAYDLAEELCGSAKKFGAELDGEGRVSAMDWHIEFGQLKDSLSDLREDYETEDGSRLELRPVVVTAPQEVDLSAVQGVRTWGFFRSLCRAMRGEYGKIARSKLKQLRTAFKQGETESRFFLQEKQIRDLLYHAFEARYQTAEERMEQYRAWRDREDANAKITESGFFAFDSTKRCLFFDAIELMDNCEFFQEVNT